MAGIRLTIYENARPSNAKVIIVPPNSTLQDVVRLSGEKLCIKAKELYFSSGADVDDIELLRDNDSIYVSAGEQVIAHDARVNSISDISSMQYELCVMGPGAVGKSALTLQFVRGVFVYDYDPTIEDAYRRNAVCDGQPAYVNILDTAGQDDFVALRPNWIRGRDGFIIVYSMVSKDSFSDVRQFLDDLKRSYNDVMPPTIIVGSKEDLSVDNPDRVLAASGEALAAEYGALEYIETSALTGKNVDKVFETLIRAIRKKRKPEDEKRSSTRHSPHCFLL